MKNLVFGLLSAALIATGAQAADKPTYARFLVGEKTYVFAQFEEGQMRLAPTEDGLQSAELLAGKPDSKTGAIVFKNVPLPVPMEALPKGCAGVKATVTRAAGEAQFSVVLAEVTGLFKDDQGTEWRYVISGGVQPRAKAAGAPLIHANFSEKPLLDIATQPKGKDSLGIVVKAKLDRADVTSIRKDTLEPKLKLRLLDSDGKEVASKEGKLSDFGFS